MLFCYTDMGYISAARIPNTVNIAELQHDTPAVTVFPNPASRLLRVAAAKYKCTIHLSVNLRTNRFAKDKNITDYADAFAFALP